LIGYTGRWLDDRVLLLVDSDAPPGCGEGTVALRLSAFAAPLGANRANDAGDEGGRGGRLLFFELGSFE